MKSIFDKSDVEQLISRINKLTLETKPQWGTMNVSQMLAHCNVMFEFTYENKHKEPRPFVRFLLKMFVKPMVVGKKPYNRGTRTAPAFLMTDDKEFISERDRLLGYIKKTNELGGDYFDGKHYNSFGVLTIDEWDRLFSKHLDHHLTQFGV